MRRLQWSALGEAERRDALARPGQRDDPALSAAVEDIVEQVRSGGWESLCAIASRVDGEAPREVEVGAIARQAREALDAPQLAAIELAAANISAFHEGCRPKDFSLDPMPGLTVAKMWRPIDRVGLYIPGGKTPLFSTLMMLALPARAAGVGEIIACTPPRPDGGLDPLVALAAQLCGIDRIWTVGGAQAVAALAFGAGAIPQVDKICGPGNAWVAEAKKQVARTPGGPAIDLPAGPSELMVIAESGSDARLVAADLLGQAEHDPMAQVLLVTPCARLALDVTDEVERQLGSLPRRAIARDSLRNARTILVDSLEEAALVANLYAPEHLSLALDDATALLPSIRNAGAIFSGPLAAETFGDYLAGSSHVLPTDGAARAWSGIGVHSFMKTISVQSVTAAAARRIAAPAAALARLESLEGHARAADLRLELAR